MTPVVLASKSVARAQILTGAGVSFTVVGSGVDEHAAKTEMLASGGNPRTVAEGLAELKAVSVSASHHGLVIGADQTLDLDGRLFDKVDSLDQARSRLVELRGRRHHLYSGVVIARDGAPIWRETADATLTMRAFSDAFLDGYLGRNADAALSSVGCYRLEGEGAQLFETIDGDYFAILGLPLLGLLDALRRYGALEQ